MSLPTLDNEKDKNTGSTGSLGLPNIDFTEDPVGVSGESQQGEFNELPVEQALFGDDKEENRQIYDEVNSEEEAQEELPVMEEEREEVAESEYYPKEDYDNDLKNNEKEKFIDKKKKKLIPFGGKKSKRFVKSSDFDDRKNKLAKTKIMQLFIIAMIILFFLIGLKNTFMPSHIYTSDQIKKFAAEGAGQTGFPEDRGRYFVENFLDAYLTFDKSKPELLETLSHYYGKEGFSNDSYSNLNMSWGTEAKQSVIVSPKVFEVNLLTDYSAQYKLSAYVTNTSGEAVDEKNSNAGRWLSFSVNVYYDKKTDSISITEDSPSIIPYKNIAEQTNIPSRVELGNGEVDKAILPAITPTIDGFVEAYAKSSLESHNSILQYVDDKDDIKLYDGFGGSVEINGDPSSAIKKVVYKTATEGIYEVDVTVNWTDVESSGEEKVVEYSSRYQMEIKTNLDGKFAVTSFIPYTYYK